MKRITAKSFVAATVGVSSAIVLSISSLTWAKPEINISVGSNTLTTSTSAGANVYMRIAGPNGYFKEIKGTSLAEWNPGPDAPDGIYRYDSYSLVTVPQGKMSERERERERGQLIKQNSAQTHGSFKLENGVVIPNKAPDVMNRSGALELKSQDYSDNFLLNAIANVLDSLVPVANAANLIASESQPTVFWTDTDALETIFSIEANKIDATRGDFFLADRVGANGHLPILIRGTDGNIDNFLSLTVGHTGDPGDMSLADGSVFIDKSTGLVGIGNITPQGGVHILKAGEAEVAVQEPGLSRWEFEAFLGNVGITENNSAQIFLVEPGAGGNSLTIDTTSNIGIGTDEPTSALHIQKEEAILSLEDTSPTTAVRNLIAMSNQGAVGFSMEDRDQMVTWDFRTNASGNFIINDVGDGSEVSILRNGNMNVAGNVVANGVLLTSSREAKADIVPVKPAEVMEKLKKVEVAEWRYKKAEKDDRHISPMAEDFYSLFQFGPSKKHINPNDLASVAIIAAQELQKKADVTASEAKMLKAETNALKSQALAFESKTKTLEAENANLKKRLLVLEQLVTNLASSDRQLSSDGQKVALNR